MKNVLFALFALLGFSANAENLLDYNFRTAQGGQWGTGSIQIYGKAALYSNKNQLVDGNPSLKDSESSIGFIVNEKFNNGLTARARIETGLLLTDGTTKSPGSIGNFESRLGIGNDNFSFDMGQGRHEFAFTITRNEPLGGNSGTLTPLIHNNRSLRLSNAMFLKTRTDSGTEFALDYGQSEYTGYTIKPMVQAATLTQFFGNDGRLGISYYIDNSNNATSTVIGGSYRVLPRLKLYTTFSFNKDDKLNDIGRTIGSKFELSGQWNLLQSYGVKTRSNLPDIEAFSNTLRYNFSKRTFFDVNYLYINSKDPKAGSSQMQFGLAHIF